MLVFFSGMAAILFSQLKFETDQKIDATVLSIGSAEGITGSEPFLNVKTDEDVTTRVPGKGAANVGDRVVLDVYDRILFSEVYRLE